jgi:hypothetical protein
MKMKRRTFYWITSVTALCALSVAVLVAAPGLEYELGDFKRFGAMKVSKPGNYKCRAMFLGIYGGYEWHPGLKRGPGAGFCYGPEGITGKSDHVYFRWGSYEFEISNRN